MSGYTCIEMFIIRYLVKDGLKKSSSKADRPSKNENWE